MICLNFIIFFYLAELILHRDEALSSIISAETFDLSLSIGQMRIEEEFGGTGMFSMFSRRISSQLSQLIVNRNNFNGNIRSIYLFRVSFYV